MLVGAFGKLELGRTQRSYDAARGRQARARQAGVERGGTMDCAEGVWGGCSVQRLGDASWWWWWLRMWLQMGGVGVDS